MSIILLRGQLQRTAALAMPALARLLPQLAGLGQQGAVSQWQWGRGVHSSRSWQRSIAEHDLEEAEAQQRKAAANRLLYRSRQRGFLELDLLVGLWAEKTIPSMSLQQLRELEVMLDQENPDLFKWLTGQLPAPEEVEANSAYRSLRAHVKEMMEENQHEATKAASGAEWRRGWDDWKGEELKPSEAAAAAATSGSSSGGGSGASA